jgi:hypothetical protein
MNAALRWSERRGGIQVERFGSISIVVSPIAGTS